MEALEETVPRYEGVIFENLDAHHIVTTKIKAKVEEVEKENLQLRWEVGSLEELLQFSQSEICEMQKQLHEYECRFKKMVELAPYGLRDDNNHPLPKN